MKHTSILNHEEFNSYCGGFTFIELAIAILVFCVGFVGMNRMQAMAIRGNAYSMQLTEAATVMKSTSERLIGLAQENTSLGGGLPMAGTAAVSSPAVELHPGRTYRPSWMVTQVPGMNLKQVTVTVRWEDMGNAHSVSDTFCK
jgi:prepilin-type N-terminal cleavage/methylation domain-containing protein